MIRVQFIYLNTGRFSQRESGICYQERDMFLAAKMEEIFSFFIFMAELEAFGRR